MSIFPSLSSLIVTTLPPTSTNGKRVAASIWDEVKTTGEKSFILATTSLKQLSEGSRSAPRSLEVIRVVDAADNCGFEAEVKLGQRMSSSSLEACVASRKIFLEKQE